MANLRKVQAGYKLMPSQSSRAGHLSRPETAAAGKACAHRHQPRAVVRSGNIFTGCHEGTLTSDVAMDSIKHHEDDSRY
jgi:hypothetical protein